MRFSGILLASLTLFVFAGSITAQSDDRDLAAAAAGSQYVVSVKPGGVNYVSGSVTVLREDGTSGPLVEGMRVEVGDIVSTGKYGRAEIMMNPGSYVRLNYNSKFRFVQTSLSSIEVDVLQGSAMFEVFASDEFRVAVNAAESRFYLTKTGVFRVDVIADEKSSLEVHKGEAQVGNLQATELKKGRMAVVTGDSANVTKFDRDLDDFEKWSKDRAKMLTNATRAFANRSASSNVNRGFASGLWGCNESFGLWMYNPGIRSYGFLPFGYWRSPYGYRFRSVFDSCSNPWFGYYTRPWIYRRPQQDDRRGNGNGGNGGNGGSGGGSGGGSSETNAQNVERGNRNLTPPFRRMENSGSVRRTSSSRGGGGSIGFPRSGSGSTRSTGSSSTRSTGSTPTRRTTSSPPVKSTSSPVRTKGKID